MLLRLRLAGGLSALTTSSAGLLGLLLGLILDTMTMSARDICPDEVVEVVEVALVTVELPIREDVS